MKTNKLTLAAAWLISTGALAQIQVTQKWELSSGLDSPESALFHGDSQSIYVSNVSGAPNEKDGQGWITQVGVDGSLINPKWADGLNAPKGMGIAVDLLWVADIDQLVAFRLADGKQDRVIDIPGSKFLNDVTTDQQGRVYVSDMVDNKIYRISGSDVEVLAAGEQLLSPNGLTVIGETLRVASWGPDLQNDFSTSAPGEVFDLDLNTGSKVASVSGPLGQLDGIEPLDSKGTRSIVSDWLAGKVYIVGPEEHQLLISGLAGAADLDYAPKQQVLFLPVMQENRLIAYSIAR